MPNLSGARRREYAVAAIHRLAGAVASGWKSGPSPGGRSEIRPVPKIRIVIAAGMVAACLIVAARAAPATLRIISVVPAATEMLYAMGAGPDIVAVSSYDAYPPQVKTLPRVGALLDPDVERILSLRPDLVVVYGSQADLIAQLGRAHVGVYNYRHGSLADVTRTMRELGERTGHGREANAAAAGIELRLSAIASRVAGRPRPRTLLVIGHEPLSLRNIYASGGTGFLHDVLSVAGGTDVFGDIPREAVQASTETVLARGPEVIVELRATAPADPERERAVWQVLPSLPAVRHHRVYFLTGDEMVVPGPRIADAAERLARTLHPDAFGAAR